MKIKRYSGEEVKSEDIKAGRVGAIRFRPRIKYSWSAGVAMSRFLEELKNGRILATTCNKCKRIMVPPRVFCEQCFKPTDGWAYVRDTGRMNTFSISHIGGDASRIKEPIVVAVIELDGASKGMGILHVMGEVKPEDVRFDMKVKAVWKSPKERTGAITDIKYFKPLKER